METIRNLVSSFLSGTGIEIIDDRNAVNEHSIAFSSVSAIDSVYDKSVDYIASITKTALENTSLECIIKTMLSKVRIDGVVLFVYPHAAFDAANGLRESDVIAAAESAGVPFKLLHKGVDDGGSGMFFVALSRRSELTKTLPMYDPSLEPVEALKKFIENDTLVLSRLDGVGDMIFMAPAVKRLKQELPGVKLVLNTRKQYAGIASVIGFDDVLLGEKKEKEYEIGIGLNWALEDHPASRILDRVSLWEDILHLPIGDSVVSLDVEPNYDLLRSHKSFDPTKKTLYFCPFSAFASRSLPPSSVVGIANALAEKYNVVMFRSHSDAVIRNDATPEHIRFVLEREDCMNELGGGKCCLFHNLPIGLWLSSVKACDIAVSCDTAGLYAALGTGVPSVGFFEHVEPWLRLRRFKNYRAIYVRQYDCRCSHHGACSKAREECKEIVDASFIDSNIVALSLGSFGCFDRELEKIKRTPLFVLVDGADEFVDEKTLACIRSTLSGVPFIISTATNGYYDVVVKDGDEPIRHILWRAAEEARSRHLLTD